MPAKSLNPRQRKFVQEYLKDPCAKEAAIKAGYSEKSAEFLGYQLLQKPLVKEAIQIGEERKAKKAEVTQDMIMSELKRLAFVNPRRIMQWGPDGVTFTASHELTEDEAACVVEASETVTKDGGTIRVKLADRVQALTLLGKQVGMFKDRVEHSGNIGTHDLSKLTNDELIAYRALAARFSGTNGVPSANGH